MLGAPFAPSTAGQIARLISSIRPARRKAPFEPPPPSSSRRSSPSSRFRISSAKPQIELLLAGEDVGDAVLAQARQMRVGDPLGQHRDDRVAADVGPPPGDLALRIERDAVRRRHRAGANQGSRG